VARRREAGAVAVPVPVPVPVAVAAANVTSDGHTASAVRARRGRGAAGFGRDRDRDREWGGGGGGVWRSSTWYRSARRIVACVRMCAARRGSEWSAEQPGRGVRSRSTCLGAILFPAAEGDRMRGESREHRGRLSAGAEMRWKSSSAESFLFWRRRRKTREASDLLHPGRPAPVSPFDHSAAHENLP
jgi:hypothetical protein